MFLIKDAILDQLLLVWLVFECQGIAYLETQLSLLQKWKQQAQSVLLARLFI